MKYYGEKNNNNKKEINNFFINICTTTTGNQKVIIALMGFDMNLLYIERYTLLKCICIYMCLQKHDTATKAVS